MTATKFTNRLTRQWKDAPAQPPKERMLCRQTLLTIATTSQQSLHGQTATLTHTHACTQTEIHNYGVLNEIKYDYVYHAGR